MKTLISIKTGVHVMVTVALLAAGVSLAAAGTVAVGKSLQKEKTRKQEATIITQVPTTCGFHAYVADYIVTPSPSAPNQYTLPSLALAAAQIQGDLNGDGTIEICLRGGTPTAPNVYTESAKTTVDMATWNVTAGFGTEPVRIFSDGIAEVTRWVNPSGTVLEVDNTYSNMPARLLTIHGIEFLNGTRAIEIVSGGAKHLVLEKDLFSGFRDTALWVGGLHTQVDVVDTRFGGNQATSGPGAILASQSAVLTLEGVSFEKNFGNEGAAITASGEAQITDMRSIFTSNVSHAMSGGKGGGAIFLGEQSGFVGKQSLFQDNVAQATAVTSGEGGALFVDDDASFSCASCLWERNQGASGGGAIASYSSVGLVLVDNTFTSNVASSGGGILLGNTMSSQHQIMGGGFNQNDATGGDGGAIRGPNSWSLYQTPSISVAINGTSFTGNHAGNIGGALAFSAGEQAINSTVFNGNNALSGGAAFFSAEAIPAISASIFINNNASVYGGGALYFVSTPATVADSTFDANSASSEGGAIFVMGDVTLTIGSSKFTNNTAKFHGGAVNINGNDSLVDIDSSTFTNNEAGVLYGWGFGGGVRCSSPGNTEFFVTNSSLSGNHSVSGGGIASDGCDMTVASGDVFSQNIADSAGGAIWGEAFGGASTIGPTFSVSEAEFNQNTSGSEGGAVRVAMVNQLFENTNFNQNTSVQGGALFSLSSTTNMTDVSFTNNTAIAGKGALYIGSYNVIGQPTSTTIDGLTAYGNSAGMYGFGVIGQGTMDLLHLDVRDNSSSDAPAGLYLPGVTGSLKNSIFAGNSSASPHPTIGSGLDTSLDFSIDFDHLTIADNDGTTSAFAVRASGAAAPLSGVLHSIGSYNPVPVQIGTSAGLGFDYNVLFTTLGTPAQNGAWTEFSQGMGNIDADPQFVGDGVTTDPSLASNILNFDFHLQPTSPAKDIDASETDVDGSPADAGTYGGPDGGW